MATDLSIYENPLMAAMNSFKWVHPVCGHEHPLTNDPRLDLDLKRAEHVPDDVLGDMLLPQPGAPADIHRSWAHPTNHAYNTEKNPLAPLPALHSNFEQTGENTWQYGGFEISQNPNELPMNSCHPSLNQGKDLSPLNAIMAALNFSNERPLQPDSQCSLGWPGAHLECPTCLRIKAQASFDKANQDMIDAAHRGGDWPSYAKNLSYELQKLNRAKAVMPLTLNRIIHPDEPPVIRGPKPEEIMRNHRMGLTADPTRRRYFDEQGNKPAAGPGNPSTADSNDARNRQSAINAAAPAFQPRQHADSPDATAPSFQGRQRADTTNIASTANYELRPRSGTTPHPPTGNFFQTVHNAFAKVGGGPQAESQGTAAQNSNVQSQPGVATTNPAQSAHRPPSRTGRSASNPTGFANYRAQAQMGHKHSKSMATPSSPSASDWPSFPRGYPQFGNAPATTPFPNAFSATKPNRAIPIVDPTTREAKGKGKEVEKAGPYSSRAAETKPAAKKKPLPIAPPKATSLFSQNRFDALTEDTEEESDSDTPHDSEHGGVNI